MNAAPGPVTVADAVPSSTEVLSAPTARQPAEVGRPAMASMTMTLWDRIRRSPGTALAAILVAVFVVVAAIAIRSGDSAQTPSAVTSPTSQPAPGGSLPEPLDRAIKSLEEAVRP